VRPRSLAAFGHAERLALGGHHDVLVGERIAKADGGWPLGREPTPLVEVSVVGDPERQTAAAAVVAVVVGSGSEEELGTDVVEAVAKELLTFCGLF
jgi:hypothetical protein